jgi:hypothetical protein
MLGLSERLSSQHRKLALSHEFANNVWPLFGKHLQTNLVGTGFFSKLAHQCQGFSFAREVEGDDDWRGHGLGVVLKKR